MEIITYCSQILKPNVIKCSAILSATICTYKQKTNMLFLECVMQGVETYTILYEHDTYTYNGPQHLGLWSLALILGLWSIGPWYLVPGPWSWSMVRGHWPLDGYKS